MKTLSIHNETGADLEPIRRLHERAFSGDAEAELVDRLRDDGDILASLVAIEGGELVGHICFSRLIIERGNESLQAAALAPVAVAPGHQRKGVGAMLILRGLDSCRKADISAVLVVGEPAYYQRFGFDAALAAELESPYRGESFMALELEEGALDGGGVARYPAAFADLE